MRYEWEMRMGVVWQDIKYALRMLARRPGFAILVVAILTIAIGANTAVFSVINTALLKSLSYDSPGRIVEVEERDPIRRSRPRPVSARTLTYWREHNQVFEYLAGWMWREMNCVDLGKSSKVDGCAISPCFFSLLGVQPALGRDFLPEEEQPGHDRVMIVSHGFWRDRLGGDPNVLGRSITTNEQDYRIVGVMPAGHRDRPNQGDISVWVPLVPDSIGADGGVWVWARLKRGVSIEQSLADMTVLEQQLTQADPQAYVGITMGVERVVDIWFESDRKLLYPLWGAVALVLLIACMNVAGLFLVHGNARRQEMAMRVTLGASRGRIVAQLLIESLLLSLAGGLFGILAAFWMIKGIIALCPADITHIDQTRIDRTVLLFTLGLSVLVGLGFGLLPAWKASGMRLVQGARGESSGPVLDRAWRRMSNGLVIAQIALALTLLIGVAMLVQSLIQLQREDLGFQPKDVAVMHVEFPESKYPQGPQAAGLVKELLQRVQAMPDVRSAGVISLEFNLGRGGAFTDLWIDGRPTSPDRSNWVRPQYISVDFFSAAGMRILHGRGFTKEDMQDPNAGVIIDENMVRRFFPGRDPIGHHIGRRGLDKGPIIGVVSSLRDYTALDPFFVAAYWPLADWCWSEVDIVVRADGDPMRLAPTLRALVEDQDKDLTVTSVDSMEETLSTMLTPRRFVMVLMGAFAQIALIVAALGLYGLLQYGVSRRTHEIGVRMALGATRERIVWTVLRQGGLLIVTGIGLGLVGGYAMSRIVASLLYETKPTDPAVLAIVLATLLGTAFAACYVPARRAAKVDPMVALRCE
ncbi:MAG: ABC transporter permease [Phycisphaerales bacterium]